MIKKIQINRRLQVIYRNELDKACFQNDAVYGLKHFLIRRLEIWEIWGAVLADTQLLSKYNKGSRFLLCVTDVYCKCAWLVPLK